MIDYLKDNTITKYKILSLYEAEHWVFDEPYVHICVTSKDTKPVLTKDENRLDVLYLIFDDATYDETPKVSGYTKDEWQSKIDLMTFEQAKEILSFFEKWKDKVKLLVVNCQAGLSRSAGIVAGICAVYGMNDDEAYRPPRHPNVFVKTMIIKAAV